MKQHTKYASICLIAIFCFACSKKEDNSDKVDSFVNPKNQKPDMYLHVEEFRKIKEGKNQIAVKEKFTNKWILLTGEINSVSSDYSLVLDDGSNYVFSVPLLEKSLSKADKHFLANVKNNQNVSLVCLTKFEKNLALEPCSIVDYDPPIHSYQLCKKFRLKFSSSENLCRDILDTVQRLTDSAKWKKYTKCLNEEIQKSDELNNSSLRKCEENAEVFKETRKSLGKGINAETFVVELNKSLKNVVDGENLDMKNLPSGVKYILRWDIKFDDIYQLPVIDLDVIYQNPVSLRGQAFAGVGVVVNAEDVGSGTHMGQIRFGDEWFFYITPSSMDDVIVGEKSVFAGIFLQIKQYKTKMGEVSKSPVLFGFFLKKTSIAIDN